MVKPFYWYSILMYIYLYKGSAMIRRDIKLMKEIEGVKIPVQLWNANVTLRHQGLVMFILTFFLLQN